MTTTEEQHMAKERKRQARLITRDLHGQDNDEQDLMGKKMSTPKEIMLEELGLFNNRGSLMFHMRQKRVEKYTFEASQNDINAKLNAANQDAGHGLQEHKGGKGLHGGGGGHSSSATHTHNPGHLAPGYSGPLQASAPEKFNEVPRAYNSPWEQAIGDDPELAHSTYPHGSGPKVPAELLHYKSFNRLAVPFGGFESASKLLTFKAPKLELPSVTTDAGTPIGLLARPNFNRTTQGWDVANGPYLSLTELGIAETAVSSAENQESVDL
uniref:myozenin-2-like n=1 Tax=Myxine glutinosa TaxID=7769 RepID=UPI00358E402F